MTNMIQVCGDFRGARVLGEPEGARYHHVVHKVHRVGHLHFYWSGKNGGGVLNNLFFSSSLISKLSKCDLLLTTHRLPSTVKPHRHPETVLSRIAGYN